jgi:hypothetical protein
VLHRHCEDLGRDPAAIERSAQVFFQLTDGASAPALPGMPAATGSAGQLAEVVAAYRAIGLDELVVPDRTLGATLADRLETMDRLREDVFLASAGS